MSRKATARAKALPGKVAAGSTAASARGKSRRGAPLTEMAAKLNARVSSQSRPPPPPAAKPAPASRRNKKGLVLYVDPAVTVALRRLSLDTGTSVQALGMAALNMLFVAHGQKPFPVAEEAP